MPPQYGLRVFTGNNIDTQPDLAFLKDVFMHVRWKMEENELQFKKVVKRSKLSQGIYKIRKTFGHKSSFPDLYLWHSTIAPLVNNDDHIPVEGLETCSMAYRLVVLGRQSQGGQEGGKGMLDKVSLPNQIEIDTQTIHGHRFIRVTMELTGPALRMLLNHIQWQAKGVIAMMDMLEHKWGSTGVAYGTYEIQGGGKWEEYRVFRMFNGVMKVQTTGQGWITGHVTGETRGGFMGQKW